MSYKLIRKISDHNIILNAGHLPDNYVVPEGYEMVVGTLTPSHIIAGSEVGLLINSLTTIFESATTQISDVPLRAYFTQLQVTVSFVLTKSVPDVELAKFYITTAVMPGDTYVEGYVMTEPFETIKQSLLSEFTTYGF